MDTVFQAIRSVMAEQRGPESIRYCGGCHDPISPFSGTKNILVENLTGPAGDQEGVSCLVCRAIRHLADPALPFAKPPVSRGLAVSDCDGGGRRGFDEGRGGGA